VAISEFRRRFLPEIEKFFVQILLIAGQAGILKLGTVSLDGTKIHANPSKHQATSLKRARAERKRLEAECSDCWRVPNAPTVSRYPMTE
jgi:hypothetical protein